MFEEEARTEGRKAARGATKGEPQAGLAPWREVVAPHPDVAQGRFEQAGFAADLFQVLTGRADSEYQDLLRIAARAPDELRRREDPQPDRPLSPCLRRPDRTTCRRHRCNAEGLSIPGNVNRAVFVGQMMSPSTIHEKDDGTQVRTLWGELAWQLGGPEGYAMSPTMTSTPPVPGTTSSNRSRGSAPR